MNKCNTSEKRRGNWFVKTKCSFCGNEIWRQKHSVERLKVFCKAPAYCRYAYKLKERDPKGFNILKQTNNSNFYYLVGLIATDGNIRYHDKPQKNLSYNCEINVNKTDEYIIDRIIFDFGGKKRKIKDNTIRWILSNKLFVDYLTTTVGLTQNKTKSLDVERWFCKLAHTEQLAFIRGVIDGDGSIKIYKKYFRTMNICSGSKTFIQMIKKFIKRFISEEKIKETNYNTYSYITMYGKNMIPFLDAVYGNISDSDIFLKRKYEVFQQIKKHFGAK